MSLDRASILRKIRACLRLSASSNQAEAATALRQAHILMSKYGVDRAAVDDIRVGEAKTRSRGAIVPLSVAMLARVVADGYRCQVLQIRTHGESTAVRFYGYAMDAEVAVYAFTVLRRQLEADKKRYTSKSLARVRSPSRKRARAEHFAIAWAAAVSVLFPKDLETDARAEVLNLAIRDQHTDIGLVEGRKVGGKKRGARSFADDLAGYMHGHRAQLRRGIGSSPTGQSPTQLALHMERGS